MLSCRLQALLQASSAIVHDAHQLGYKGQRAVLVNWQVSRRGVLAAARPSISKRTQTITNVLTEPKSVEASKGTSESSKILRWET